MSRPPKPPRLRRRTAINPRSIDALKEASKATRWLPGVSGNKSGRSVEFKQFVERCRETTPEVFAELLAMLRLPRQVKYLRWKAFAAAELLNRAWGKSPQVVIDAPGAGNKETKAIPMTPEYWVEVVRALRESGALDTPVKDADTDDAEDAIVVGSTKLIEPPKPGDQKLLN